MSKSAVTKETGVRHFFAAAGYSWGGFRRLLKEAAFRQELLFFVVAQIILVATGTRLSDILVSIFLFLGLFAAEALNTAVEEVIDRISPELSNVGKHAKDLGSFAVFCMLVACGLHLAFTVFSHYWLG
ncbi:MULTISPECIES: diacylglycerol kinase [Rhizobium]|uniref:Diacylglycerol kinase n=2 Tax=Rhizobium TaxID=379 RepID=A0AAF1K741_9HYPH|nr:MULTISPECIES: diacylglycerol kinase [Rhizobium]MBZ5758280.1 diacylglycerol kinase [Rhizobium sp. VS19-DR96]MBZ5764890.1 diacylglycerol kinase [Rhizobium sp. VS19-DR129.2]MBZ5772433.1 diacylglycerol kinase [Rhizobium sp. VS19-DRK62.2]MBZ5782880.1 diacylglycerol kinase [Rhizobium sp. VS19-DR121]MBZ5800328.1 diacylglycerol kinase [Rhizobium sp. VS19-DR181]